MGAKRSGEMKYAVSLYRKYKSYSKAALEAGVHPASLYKVLISKGILQKKRVLAKVA